MPMSATGSDPRDAGFTLAEMLVALAIAALLAASVVSFWPRQQAGAVALHAAAQTLAADLRLARGLALAENRRVVVELGDFTTRHPAIRLADAAPARVVFQADGTTAGGVIPLVAGNRQLRVQVARFSGRVDVTE